MSEPSEDEEFDISEELGDIEESPVTLGDMEQDDPVDELEDINDRMDDAEARIALLENGVNDQQVSPDAYDPIFTARLTGFTSGQGGKWQEQFSSSTSLVDYVSGRFTSATTNSAATFGLPETGFLAVEQVEPGAARFPAVFSGIVDVYLTQVGGGSPNYTYDGYLDSGKTIKVFAAQTGLFTATTVAARGTARLVNKTWRFIGPLVDVPASGGGGGGTTNNTNNASILFIRLAGTPTGTADDVTGTDFFGTDWAWPSPSSPDPTQGPNLNAVYGVDLKGRLEEYGASSPGDTEQFQIDVYMNVGSSPIVPTNTLLTVPTLAQPAFWSLQAVIYVGTGGTYATGTLIVGGSQGVPQAVAGDPPGFSAAQTSYPSAFLIDGGFFFRVGQPSDWRTILESVVVRYLGTYVP